MEGQQELRLEVQRRTKLVEETQKPDDETTPSTATTGFAISQITRKRRQIITLTARGVNGSAISSYVLRLTTGMMLNVLSN